MSPPRYIPMPKKGTVVDSDGDVYDIIDVELSYDRPPRTILHVKAPPPPAGEGS